MQPSYNIGYSRSPYIFPIMVMRKYISSILVVSTCTKSWYQLVHQIMLLLSSMTLYIQVISMLFHASLCISISNSSEISTCPTWTYPSPPHNEYVCGDTLDGGIFCDPDTLTVSITMSIFFSEQVQIMLAGTGLPL